MSGGSAGGGTSEQRDVGVFCGQPRDRDDQRQRGAGSGEGGADQAGGGQLGCHHLVPGFMVDLLAIPASCSTSATACLTSKMACTGKVRLLTSDAWSATT